MTSKSQDKNYETTKREGAQPAGACEVGVAYRLTRDVPTICCSGSLLAGETWTVFEHPTPNRLIVRGPGVPGDLSAQGQEVHVSRRGTTDGR